MRFLLVSLIALGSLTISCNLGRDYLKEKLQYEKLDKSCTNVNQSINVEANTIGERYVFEACLPAEYKGEHSVKRKGDTIDVIINKYNTGSTAFKITLDIDTKPGYNFITIDGNTMPITVKRD